jgi:hypothetical protein
MRKQSVSRPSAPFTCEFSAPSVLTTGDSALFRTGGIPTSIDCLWLMNRNAIVFYIMFSYSVTSLNSSPPCNSPVEQSRFSRPQTLAVLIVPLQSFLLWVFLAGNLSRMVDSADPWYLQVYVPRRPLSGNPTMVRMHRAQSCAVAAGAIFP